MAQFEQPFSTRLLNTELHITPPQKRQSSLVVNQ